MRIVVDGRTLLSDKPRGTGKAFTEVYKRLAVTHPDWEFVVVHRNSRSTANPFESIPNIATRALDLPGHRLNLWQSLGLPWIGRSSDAQLIHCPANTGPRWSPTPILVTIHDLIPIQPDFRGSSWRKWAKRVARIAHRARYVTTPSEFSRRQIMETFGISGDKVISIPWAASSTCRPLRQRGDLNRLRAKYRIDADQPYVLAFGAEDPRKNTRRILEAWSRVSSAQRDETVLLIIGVQDNFRQELQSGLSTEMVSRVRLHGYIPEADVPGLLSGAEFLCFPTLYEGFGLPVLDAFACESAVLTSRNSSIPEVAGEAVMYVDPYSAESIADGMILLLGDEQLQAQLVDAGRQQANKFSWDRCAEQYGDVIHQFAK